MYGIFYSLILVNCRSFGKAKGKSRLIREDEHDISDEEGEDGGGAGGGGRVVSFGTTNEPGRQMQVLCNF